MDVVVWLAVLVTGLWVAVKSSRWAVDHVTEFAAGTRIPPFVIGITLVSIGTDLPEIANSAIASITGHGDINVGNAIGSATVQATLILGLLPIIAGSFPLAKGRVGRIGLATVGALIVGATLMIDGHVSRIDAVVLLGVWVLGTILVWRDLPADSATYVKTRKGPQYRSLGLAMIGLIVVGFGATTAIQALSALAEIWALPEYIVAFFLASIGTSLPELTVELSAVRRGQWDLAVGDAFGSSFIDATLSLGIGPLITPIAVTAGAAVAGSLVASVAIGTGVLVLVQRKEHDKVSGAVLVGIFLVSYLFVFNLT